MKKLVISCIFALASFAQAMEQKSADHMIKFFDLRKNKENLNLSEQKIVEAIEMYDVKQTALSLAKLIYATPHVNTEDSLQNEPIVKTMSEKIMQKQYADMKHLDEMLQLNLNLYEKNRYILSFIKNVEYTAEQIVLNAKKDLEEWSQKSWAADKAPKASGLAFVLGACTVGTCVYLYPKNPPDGIRELGLGGFFAGVGGLVTLPASVIWWATQPNKKSYYTQQSTNAQTNHEMIKALNKDLTD